MILCSPNIGARLHIKHIMKLKFISAIDKRAHSIVPRIQVKIALNVGKAWNLVQMKLLSHRSRTDLRTNLCLLFVWQCGCFKHKCSPLTKKIQENDLLAFKNRK